LDELIECVAHAADRAESAAYSMSGTPKAKSSRGRGPSAYTPVGAAMFSLKVFLLIFISGPIVAAVVDFADLMASLPFTIGR
jgi:hypothetical protein